MRLFLFSLVVSVILVGSVAFSSEVSVESLEGRTQVDAAGYVGYSTESQFFWFGQGSAFHYLTPHFGVGGSLALNGSSGEPVGYSLGPAVEYFFPLAERHHLLAQGAIRFHGSSGGSSRSADNHLETTATAGYRYFITNDIAVGARLMQTWQKNPSQSGALERAGGLNMLFGFSIFF